MKNTRSADFCAYQIDAVSNSAVIMDVVIKRVHCILLFQEMMFRIRNQDPGHCIRACLIKEMLRKKV